MAAVDEEQFVAVPVGPCRCSGRPDSPHPEGDIVWLRRKAGTEMALAAEGALRRSGRKPGDVDAALGGVFLRYGIARWTFLDEKGQPVPVGFPVDPDVLDEWLPWDNGGYELADTADNMYTGTVLGPLLRRNGAQPQPMPVPSSTSQTSPSELPTQSSSPPSSPSTAEDGMPSEPIGALH